MDKMGHYKRRKSGKWDSGDKDFFWPYGKKGILET
ncbi:hypothetical protein BH23BAC1_BH23BAC1_42760 [soil metagenome]